MRTLIGSVKGLPGWLDVVCVMSPAPGERPREEEIRLCPGEEGGREIEGNRKGNCNGGQELTGGSPRARHRLPRAAAFLQLHVLDCAGPAEKLGPQADPPLVRSFVEVDADGLLARGQEVARHAAIPHVNVAHLQRGDARERFGREVEVISVAATPLAVARLVVGVHARAGIRDLHDNGRVGAWRRRAARVIPLARSDTPARLISCADINTRVAACEGEGDMRLSPFAPSRPPKTKQRT